jgi:hypothetical protein
VEKVIGMCWSIDDLKDAGELARAAVPAAVSAA